jgi:hypothetical protein
VILVGWWLQKTNFQKQMVNLNKITPLINNDFLLLRYGEEKYQNHSTNQFP